MAAYNRVDLLERVRRKRKEAVQCVEHVWGAYQSAGACVMDGLITNTCYVIYCAFLSLAVCVYSTVCAFLYPLSIASISFDLCTHYTSCLLLLYNAVCLLSTLPVITRIDRYDETTETLPLMPD